MDLSNHGVVALSLISWQEIEFVTNKNKTNKRKKSLSFHVIRQIQVQNLIMLIEFKFTIKCMDDMQIGNNCELRERFI